MDIWSSEVVDHTFAELLSRSIAFRVGFDKFCREKEVQARHLMVAFFFAESTYEAVVVAGRGRLLG